MTFDKSLWNNSIGWLKKSKLPSWPCPICGDGILLLDFNLFRSQKTKKRESTSNNNIFPAFKEPEGLLDLVLLATNAYVSLKENSNWNYANFNAFLKCSNVSCSEFVSICGTSKIPAQHQGNVVEMSIGECIRPNYFHPPLSFMKFSFDCPNEIREELTRSFALFFCDPSAAGNRVRASIELLLDKVNIPRVYLDDHGQPLLNKLGKEKEKGLHARIEEFSINYKKLGELLLAVKLSGNEGSHGNTLTQGCLLEAYEVINFLIEELFIRPKKHNSIKLVSDGLIEKYKK